MSKRKTNRDRSEYRGAGRKERVASMPKGGKHTDRKKEASRRAARNRKDWDR